MAQPQHQFHWPLPFGYRVKLNRALETHPYNRDDEKVDERIIAKLPALVVQVVGKDIERVETLIRKHDNIENQIQALCNRVHDLAAEKHGVEKLSVGVKLLKDVGKPWMQVSEALSGTSADLGVGTNSWFNHLILYCN